MQTRPKPREMSFMDKLVRRVKSMIQATVETPGTTEEKAQGRRQSRRKVGQYLTAKTSPRFFGTFRPLRPFARIKPKRWRVLEQIPGLNGKKIMAERQCSIPERDGFMSALPAMFVKRGRPK